MRFVLFLLVNAMLFIRPEELFPWLGDSHIYLFCIAACFFVSWPSILEMARKRNTAAPPILACTLGLLIAIPFSDLANGKMDQVFDHTLDFLKVIVYLILLVSLVNTTERLRRFVFWIGIFSTMTAFLATVQYYGAVELRAQDSMPAQQKKRNGFVQEKFRDPDTGKMVDVRRMCGTGLFNDPNDLGLVLVAGVSICLFWLLRREAGTLRLLWLGPLAIFLNALLLTHSRGSLLGLLASLAVLCLLRYGMRKSMLVGACVFPVLLAVFAGRMTDFSSPGTGQSRIVLWSDGMHMFRESPLWGVGMHQFVAYARLVAHNSFIHCFAELGLLGGCLFLGAFAFALFGLIRVAKNPDLIHDAELRNLFPYVMAIFVAFLVGIMFLSRSYVVPTYTMLGLVIAFLRLVPLPMETSERTSQRLVPRPVWTLMVTSVAFLMASETFVRLFAGR